MKLIRLDPTEGATVGVEHAPGEVLPIRHIIGIGRNYAEHAHEQGADVPERPMVFTKSPGAACLDGDDIVVPKICQNEPQVDYEAELAVIIGKPTRDVREDDVWAHVLGLCCGNDVSARWWQKKGSGGQFCRGKSFDTFCPLGPEFLPVEAVGDVTKLGVRCRINGEERQNGNTSQMIFPVASLIADLSRGATLLPGTLIMTGTPSGVGMAMAP
ncbi:MAG: fumarylacetoacetate hydrolase family protein, partial [Planctomycetota bacterium]